MPFLQGNRTFGKRYPTFDTYTSKVTKTAKAGDVIMSVRAPVGDLNFTPVDMGLGRGVCSIRMKNGNQDFLFYLLKYYMPLLLNKESGTVFGSVNRNDINGLEVTVPDDPNQQQLIARYLTMLDEKIDNNDAINDNLLQQAEALFKDRFLNTDSVSDGWKIQTLGDVSDMSAGGDKPKTISDSKTDECQYPIYSNGIRDEGLYGYTNDYKILEECVTVSARGTIGYVCLRHIPFTPIVRLVTLIPHKGTLSAKYLYLWLKNIQIHGTGTTQQQLTVPDFRKTEIVIPSKESMTQFTETIDPLFQQIWANQEQNATLANIRDTLLPKLMSGELDVSDIDI
jgi:type I restriction enzyme S subunit